MQAPGGERSDHVPETIQHGHRQDPVQGNRHLFNELAALLSGRLDGSVWAFGLHLGLAHFLCKQARHWRWRIGPAGQFTIHCNSALICAVLSMSVLLILSVKQILLLIKNGDFHFTNFNLLFRIS